MLVADGDGEPDLALAGLAALISLAARDVRADSASYSHRAVDSGSARSGWSGGVAGEPRDVEVAPLEPSLVPHDVVASAQQHQVAGPSLVCPAWLRPRFARRRSTHGSAATRTAPPACGGPTSFVATSSQGLRLPGRSVEVSTRAKDLDSVHQTEPSGPPGSEQAADIPLGIHASNLARRLVTVGYRVPLAHDGVH